MWQSWIDVPEYSHGLLIPPVAAFLIWQQKDRLERMAFSGSWWGVALVAWRPLLVPGSWPRLCARAVCVSDHAVSA